MGWVSIFFDNFTRRLLNLFGTCRTFYPSIPDYFITSIGGESPDAGYYWKLFRNNVALHVGGCQQRIYTDDKILFAISEFLESGPEDNLLKLYGPPTAFVNQPVTFTVTEGSTGIPVAGAEILGYVTDTDGKVDILFVTVGPQSVKATKAHWVWSDIEIEIVNQDGGRNSQVIQQMSWPYRGGGN